MIREANKEERNQEDDKLVYNIDNILEKSNKGLEELTVEFEKRIIKNHIRKYGNTTEGKKIVANKPNIGLTTLYRKLNDYKEFS